MKRKRRLFLASFLVALFVLIFPPWAGAETLYYVDGEDLTWVLEGVPDEARAAEFRSVRLTWVSETNEPLYFQLSNLEDDHGHRFPRESVVVRTHYDSAEQNWGRISDARVLLAATDEYADFEIGVNYHKAVPAGIYRGELFTDTGGSIPLEIVVERFTELTITPHEIEMEIGSGPGDYRAADTLQVQVLANHQDWVLSLSSAGLFYSDEEESGRSFLQRGSQKPQMEPIELFMVHKEKTMSFHEVPKIMGVDYAWWGTSLEFNIQTKVGWEHKAGKYSGVIRVDVELDQ